MPTLRVRQPKREPSPLPSDFSFGSSDEEAPVRKNSKKRATNNNPSGGLFDRFDGVNFEDADDPIYNAAGALGIHNPASGQNGVAWHPAEDKCLMDAYRNIGAKWALVAQALNKAGFQRTPAMARNRYQRMTYDSSRSRRVDGAPKNRCKKCGQIKRGHTCLAGLPGASRALPPEPPVQPRVKRVRVTEPVKQVATEPTPSLTVWTMEDVDAAPSTDLKPHSLVTQGFPGVQLTADKRSFGQLPVEQDTLSHFLDSIHKPPVVSALPVSGPHSFFLASAMPPPIVNKVPGGGHVHRQMSSMSSIGDVANACDLSELVDLSDLQSAALSALASKSFASFGNNNAPGADAMMNGSSNANPDSPTLTSSEATDIVPAGYVPPPPVSRAVSTLTDVAAVLSSKAISAGLLYGGTAADGDQVPAGYVPPPPEVGSDAVSMASSMLPWEGNNNNNNNMNPPSIVPSYSRAPSFSWIDNCLNGSTPEGAPTIARSRSNMSATASRVASWGKNGAATANEAAAAAAVEALAAAQKLMQTPEGSPAFRSNLPTQKMPPPLLCMPAPPKVIDETVANDVPMPPMPRRTRSRDSWGRVGA